MHNGIHPFALSSKSLTKLATMGFMHGVE